MFSLVHFHFRIFSVTFLNYTYTYMHIIDFRYCDTKWKMSFSSYTSGPYYALQRRLCLFCFLFVLRISKELLRYHQIKSLHRRNDISIFPWNCHKSNKFSNRPKGRKDQSLSIYALLGSMLGFAQTCHTNDNNNNHLLPSKTKKITEMLAICLQFSIIMSSLAWNNTQCPKQEKWQC